MQSALSTVDARYAKCVACHHAWTVDPASWGPGMTCPACAIPTVPQQFFGHYQIVRQIATGGLGTVHEAIDSLTGRSACVKLLRDEIFEDPAFVQNFAHEAQIVASIAHPNVVEVYEFSQWDGAYFLAMEFLDHGTLQSRMATGPIAEGELLQIMLDVARGLLAASTKGLLHRDVKPGNILFDSFNRAKLVDFGLSLHVDETRRQQGLVWGSPYYIAPERLEGAPEDFRADIYSLGATIFHAAAGRPLFRAKSPSLMAWKHLKAQKVSVKTFAPHLHDETAWIINRCVQREPRERFLTYFELIESLESAKKHVALAMPLKTRPLELERDDGGFSSRLKWVGVAAAAAIVAISSITLAVVRNKDRGILDFRTGEGEITQGPSASAVAPAPPISADATDPSVDIGYGWRSVQIGQPDGRGGTISATESSLSLWHEGNDVWGSADSCCFAFKRALGDFEMIAKIEAVRGGHEQWNKAGIMLRASLAAGSKNAYLMVAPQSGTRLQRRLAEDDVTGPNYSGGEAQPTKRQVPVWVKLVRSSSMVIAFDSTDGPSGPWRQRDRIEIDLPEQVFVGPAICAHGTGYRLEADFMDLRFAD